MGTKTRGARNLFLQQLHHKQGPSVIHRDDDDNDIDNDNGWVDITIIVTGSKAAPLHPIDSIEPGILTELPRMSSYS